MLNVNLLAPVRIGKALSPALRKASNPKIIIKGTNFARNNIPSREVADSAAKFERQGVVYSLHEELQPYRISVTVINPGNTGTAEVLSGQERMGAPAIIAISLNDLRTTISCMLTYLDNPVSEIDVPAMTSNGA